MSSAIALKAADNIAPQYDRYLNERGWVGPDVVFGILQSSITTNQILLDIGIGTGLSSIKFHEAGVKIYGVDGSAEMIKVCSRKNFAQELVQCNLCEMELPFKGMEFDFIIAYGVFHIIGFIDRILREAATRLSNNGIFLFSVVENDSFLIEAYGPSNIKGIFEHRNSQSGILNFCHNDSYMREVIANAGLEMWLKKLILAFRDIEEKKEVHFSIYTCRKLPKDRINKDK